jgi:hypothetical protein
MIPIRRSGAHTCRPLGIVPSYGARGRVPLSRHRQHQHAVVHNRVWKENIVLKLAPFALVALLMTVTPAAAQECQTRTLPLEVTLPGEFEATDCRFPTYCEECLANPHAEYWVIDVPPDEVVAITLTGVTAGVMHWGDVNGRTPIPTYPVRMDEECHCWRQWLRAGPNGVTYRFTALARGKNEGTYTVRAERVTTPLPAVTWVWKTSPDDLDVSWDPYLARSPILEYVIEVGRSPGTSDLGVFSLGLPARGR